MALLIELLPALFQDLQDGVCVADGEGRIQYMNPAAERLLRRAGASATPVRVCDELCGRLDLPCGLPRRGPCPLLDASSPERAVTFEGFRDGAVHGLRVRCLRLSLDATAPLSYPGHLIFIEDDARELDRRRRQEDWRSMMVHDVRVPLSCAFGAFRALQDSSEKRSPEEKELLEIGVRSCRKMISLLEDFLDAARLMNAASAARAPVGLAGVVASCERDLRQAALARRVEIVLAVPPDLIASADERLLTRLVQNLLDNAVKHAPDGGRVEASARAAGGIVELRVKDTGEGIPAEALAGLFEPFFQAPRDRRVGSGLGLAFCREAARVMGGDVVVAASSKSGTEMLVTLPLAAREEKP